VQGDGEAEFPSSSRYVALPLPIFLRQSSLPALETQINTMSSPAGDVTHTRGPKTMGLEPAGPGNAKRQATLSVLLHWVGALASVLRLSKRAPRHCGQSSATVADGRKQITRSA
jgi:hypothetical protein